MQSESRVFTTTHTSSGSISTLVRDPGNGISSPINMIFLREKARERERKLDEEGKKRRKRII